MEVFWQAVGCSTSDLAHRLVRARPRQEIEVTSLLARIEAEGRGEDVPEQAHFSGCMEPLLYTSSRHPKILDL